MIAKINDSKKIELSIVINDLLPAKKSEDVRKIDTLEDYPQQC